MLKRAGMINIMVQTKTCCTELTPEEQADLKMVTGKPSMKEALIDAVEYRIMHPSKKAKVEA